MQITTSGSTNYDSIITVAEIKAHLRVTHSLEDDLIDSIRVAAVNFIENYCNVKLGSFTAYGYLPRWVASYIPVGPVTAISAVEYETDNAGTLATLDTSNWHVDTRSRPARITFSDYPAPYEHALMPIRITMTVGHSYDSIPGTLMSAIRLICAHLYENRQEEVMGTLSSRIKLGVDALVSGERIIYQA